MKFYYYYYDQKQNRTKNFRQQHDYTKLHKEQIDKVITVTDRAISVV